MGPGVLRILGNVPSLAPHLEAARIIVAPIRYGAGLKGKIIEGLANGVPVVTTSIGTEGIGLVEGVNSLIADDAQTFANALVRLDSDHDLWESISQGGSPPSTSASRQGDSANPSAPFSLPCLSGWLQKPDLQLAEVRLQPVGPSTQR